MKPTHSLVTTHPDFIGPRISARDKTRIWMKQDRERNPENQLLAKRKQYAKDPSKYIAKVKEYYKNNKADIRVTKRAYHNQRLKNDPAYRMRTILRTRMYIAVKGHRKAAATMTMIGCTREELMAYIESRFLPGMTWDNFGKNGWHIDHIIPCAAFDMTIPEHQAMCFHYTNLRPLWAKDNGAKSDKITPEAIALLVSKQESVETDGPFYLS